MKNCIAKLSTPQQNIWNLQQYYEDTCISNICGSVLWERKYDIKTVKQAINKVIELQSGLRLHFCEKNGDIVQYVSNYTYREIPFHSFAGIDEFKCYANEFAQKPFVPINSDMFNFEIVEVDGKIGVLACMSHLISDAWSFSLLVKNVTYVCECIEKHTEIDLASENYLEYVESEANYLSSPRFQKAKRYWEEKYSAQPENSPIKMLPSVIAAPTAKRFSMQLSADDSQSLDRFCNDTGINQAVLFEAALYTYLKRLNPDNHAVTVGVPVLNRVGLEKNIIGMFISTMPLTVEISENYSAIKLCDEITTAHAQLFRYQKYPYSYILSDLRKKSNFSGNLYDVMISYQNAKTDSEAKTEWYSNGYSETPFVIHIDNRDSEDSYTLTVDYQAEVFRQDDEIGFIIDRLIYIIKQIIENPEITLSKIDIIPEKEYKQLIFEFNDTAVEYDTGKCVHEIFETVAMSHSEETAVIACDRTLTYGELDKEANKIANALIDAGVKNNDIVAIVLPREAAFISAMLGVLKSGGAYMPVAYDYPIERINYMLESSKAKCIITTFELKEKFNNSLVIDILLDGNNSTAPGIPVNFDDIFCALHTSGSTGKPKMAALTHRNAVNFIYANRYMFNGISQSLCSTIVTFDVFFQETLAALCSELPIVLLSEEQITNQGEFEKVYESYDHSFSFFTPTKIESYIKNSLSKKFLKHIDTFCLGGETISRELVKTLYCNNNILYGYGPTETFVGSTYKKIDIHFVYGPTETTIWSTNSKLDMTDITIGKPIANTQVYILDKNRKVLPIGVAGELCISGDGVGAGYLNQPELTAEKYISNPFIDGKIMYCTGDLARWRTDGEIEFIGRIDNQIKLHGQRVELGEIESVMSEFNGIKITAVTDKKDENGHQYLVGYYTADCDIDEKALRQHLGTKLPKYMIPNHFVCLDTMPMTPSGKIDRKNLPLPNFNIFSEEYHAPKTEREIILCSLLSELFSTEKIGVSDNFFDIGGDSLKAIEYTAKAHNRGVNISLQNVFDYPTVRELCDFLEKGALKTNSYTAADFEKYDSILKRNVIDESFVPKKRSLGNVLITGATGFLGAHILDSVMENEKGKVYCLVRSGSENDRRGRLAKILNYYFGNKYDNEIGKRIIPIVGDITEKGLSSDVPMNVQTVIHTAATVKHYGSYDYFRSVNVEGTRNVVDYAKSVNAKLVHISTLSVSGNSLADEFEVYRSKEEKDFYESSLYIEQPLENVYVISKFEAELEVLNAMLCGLDAKIIRVGNLTNRLSDCKFQPNYDSNAFLTRFKAALDIRILPDYLLPLYAEFSPIDQTADGVVKISQYANEQCVFHLNSNRPIYFDRMIEILEELGINMKVVTGKCFNETLEELAKNANTEYIYEAFQNDMDDNGQLVYDSNINIKNDFTVWFMKKIGFEWAKLDIDYIRAYIQYFKAIEYFR